MQHPFEGDGLLQRCDLVREASRGPEVRGEDAKRLDLAVRFAGSLGLFDGRGVLPQDSLDIAGHPAPGTRSALRETAELDRQASDVPVDFRSQGEGVRIGKVIHGIENATHQLQGGLIAECGFFHRIENRLKGVVHQAGHIPVLVLRHLQIRLGQ